MIVLQDEYSRHIYEQGDQFSLYFMCSDCLYRAPDLFFGKSFLKLLIKDVVNYFLKFYNLTLEFLFMVDKI